MYFEQGFGFKIFISNSAWGRKVEKFLSALPVTFSQKASNAEENPEV